VTPLINIIPTPPSQWRNWGLFQSQISLVYGVSFLMVLLSLLPLPPGEGAEQNGTARHLLFALLLICDIKNLVRQSLTLRGTSYGMASIQGSILLGSGSGSAFPQWCEAGSDFHFDANPDYSIYSVMRSRIPLSLFYADADPIFQHDADADPAPH
jgi:hypothetical protein